ncbi:MAG: ABC transporter permease [Acidobacteriota bacterium]
MKIREPISHRRYIGLSLVPFVLVLVLWSALTYTGLVQPFFLPSPTSVLSSLLDVARTGQIFRDMWDSTFRVVMAFLISVVLAVPLGILVGCYLVFEALAEPINNLIRYLPVVSFIPLCILWIGIDDEEKIAVIFLGTFFQLLVLVADSARSVPQELLNTAYTLGARQHQAILKVVLPACLPQIYDALRVSMGWAWSYLVVAEIVAATSGVGHFIIQSQRFLETANVIAGILVIGVLGLAFDMFFKYTALWFFPWNVKKTTS